MPSYWWAVPTLQKKPPGKLFLSGFLFLLETFTQPVYVYFLKNFFLPTPASPTSPLPSSSMVAGSGMTSPFIPHLRQECRGNPFIPFLFLPTLAELLVYLWNIPLSRNKTSFLASRAVIIPSHRGLAEVVRYCQRKKPGDFSPGRMYDCSAANVMVPAEECGQLRSACQRSRIPLSSAIHR